MKEIDKCASLLISVFRNANKIRRWVETNGVESESLSNKFEWIAEFEEALEEIKNNNYDIKKYYEFVASVGCKYEASEKDFELPLVDGWNDKVEEIYVLTLEEVRL